MLQSYPPQPGGPQGAGGYIYIQILDMFHIFSLVCFLIYGVNRRQVPPPYRKTTFICFFKFYASYFLQCYHFYQN